MRTFLLGTGCQKGGTTWLFRYLKSSPQYVAGFRKEYHVFDALDVPSMAYRRDEVLGDAEQALARGRAGGPVNAQAMLLAAMLANPTFYFDYFAGLLATRSGGRLTADVTPSYGMLSAARLAQIRDEFAERGVRTASIFLMRDPVDRVVSQLRMQVRRNPERFERPLPEVLLARHDRGEHGARSRYDHTIEALDATFGPEDVYFGFYESLFQEDRLRDICDFLGIDYRTPSFDVRHNASPPADLPESVLRQVAATYRPIYEAVAARFPEVDLMRLWPGMRLLG